MIRAYKIIFFTMIILLSYSSITFAGDDLDRFMHNDQDLLIVGQIKEKDNDNFVISVSHFIVSEKSLDQSKPLFKERPTQVEVSNFIYGFNIINLTQEELQKYQIPKVGDNVLLSLNKESDVLYSIRWHRYKVTSSDYKTLKIILPPKATESMKAYAAAIECFINSDGKYTEFKFDDNNKIYLNINKNEMIQIYPKESGINSNVQQTVYNIVQSIIHVSKNNVIFIISVLVGIVAIGIIINRIKRGKIS